MAARDPKSTSPDDSQKFLKLPIDSQQEDASQPEDEPKGEKFTKIPEESKEIQEPTTKTPSEKETKAGQKGESKGGPTKRAVIAGINAYPAPNALPSCVADAQAFENLLRLRFGFADIHTILDAQVTVAEFERQLDWLVDGATAGSQLVLYYSGHGYAGETRPGVIEEFLVLFDNFLQDDRLVQRTQNLPPGALTVVLDSCFSGGMEKRFFEVVDENNGEVAKVKRLFAPPDLMALEEQAVKNVTVLKPFGGSEYFVPKGKLAGRKSIFTSNDPVEAGQPGLNGLLISACLETETAAASTARTNGLSAFTCCLLRSLNSLGAGASVIQLIERTLTELQSLGFEQTPQVKEPSQPGNMTYQPFLSAAGAGGGAPTPGGVFGEDLISMLRRQLEQYLNPTGKGVVPMFPSTQYTGTQFSGPAYGAGMDAQKAWYDTVLNAVVQVLPTVIAAASKSGAPGSPAPLPMAPGGMSMDAQSKWFGAVLSAVTQVLPVIIEAATKNVGPVSPAPLPMQAGGAGMVSQDKWFGAVLSAVTQVLPVIIEAATKNVGAVSPATFPLPTSGATMDTQKGWFDILSTVPQLLPVIIEAATKSMPAPAQPASAAPAFNTPAEQAKFFETLIPILVSTIPPIIEAVTKGQAAPGFKAAPAPALNPADQQKFLDALIPLIPVIINAIPPIVDAVTKSILPPPLQTYPWYPPYTFPAPGQVSIATAGTPAADQQKFWGTLIPILVSSIPTVVDLVTKGQSPQPAYTTA